MDRLYEIALALRWQGENDLEAPEYPVGNSGTGSRAAYGAINAG